MPLPHAVGVQLESQPSPSMVLPSSQPSPGSDVLLPQRIGPCTHMQPPANVAHTIDADGHPPQQTGGPFGLPGLVHAAAVGTHWQVPPASAHICPRGHSPSHCGAVTPGAPQYCARATGAQRTTRAATRTHAAVLEHKSLHECA